MLTKIAKYLLWGVFTCVFIGAVSFVVLASRTTDNPGQESLTVTPKPLKDTYDLHEPVSILLDIANYGAKPLYIYMDQSGVIDYLYITVKDANNVRIWWDHRLETIQPVPGHWFLRKEGKRTFIRPVTEVKPGQTLRAIIPDALKEYRHRVQRGTYHLTIGYMPVIHEVSPILTRKEVRHPLWIDPSTVVRRSTHEVGTVTIRIQ